MQSGKKVLLVKEILCKNDLNIEKDVLMIYVNLIAIGSIVSEKMEGNCFPTNCRMHFFTELSGFF
jgi:hypothetical protein